MLERLFGSEARLRLLDIILFQPSERHLRELARMTRTTPIHTKRELENLEAAGLVSHRKQGNLSLFKPRPESPVFADLKSLFAKTRAIGPALMSKLGSEGIEYALIYGSFAKGDERAGSDIDLLVIGDVDEKRLNRAAMHIEGATGREINYILWTPAEFKKKARDGIALLVDIKKGRVIMLRGEENGFKRTIEERRHRTD